MHDKRAYRSAAIDWEAAIQDDLIRRLGELVLIVLAFGIALGWALSSLS